MTLLKSRPCEAGLLELSALLFVLTGSALAAGDPAASASSCAADNGGLTLSPGFCASVFADNLGHARHLTVAANGVVYVNTWSGAYYTNKKLPAGGFLVALRDTTGTGHADEVQRFGDGVAEGSAGGTGIALYKGALYAEQNDRIIRYALPPGAALPTQPAQVVVSGLPIDGDHPMHPFIIDANGSMFIDVGSATNACDLHNRMPLTRGHAPCTELNTRAGIWRYDANKLNQKFSPADRYATGIRNGEGMSFDAAGRLFLTQHGRDQLAENFQSLYATEQGHELPAEELLVLEKSGDYGWPQCYFDGFQKKLVLAPEYGGDGGKTVGECAKKLAPIAFFPAHWAPNALVIYSGTQFPKPYRGGAFIAFHGSWNRAPAPQGGYNVVYQPLANGAASGDYVVFADGFAGKEKAPGRAAFRPSGLALGPDGALFVSDDVHGRVWRISYSAGNADSVVGVAPAPPPPLSGSGDSRRPVASLPLPPGVTREVLVLGDQIFHGEARGGTCAGCHASDGSGSEVGPDLTSGHWAWGDGSLAAIERTITRGVVEPKNATGAMPPLGGAQLSKTDVHAVAAYVYAISSRGAAPK